MWRLERRAAHSLPPTFTDPDIVVSARVALIEPRTAHYPRFLKPPAPATDRAAPVRLRMDFFL